MVFISSIFSNKTLRLQNKSIVTKMEELINCILRSLEMNIIALILMYFNNVMVQD